jgi:hypothetical protein
LIKDGYAQDIKYNYWNVLVFSEFCGPKTRIFRRADNNSEWLDTTGRMYFSDGRWIVLGDVLNPVDNFELKKYTDLCWFQGVNSVDDMMGDGNTPKWLDYFESRYPDDDNLNALYEAGKKVPYNLYKWLRFCQDCNQHLTEEDGDITIGGVTVAGTPANRLKKFEQDLHTVANVHVTGAYHVVTDYKAAVDQRSKNMMVGFYLDTDGVVRMYLNHLYDGDTIDESDNDCGLTIPWNLDPNNDTRGMYQGWDSVLFVQMAKAGTIYLNDEGTSTTTLRAIAKEMREAKRSDGLKPFSVDGCRKYWVTDRLSKWPKVVSSYDGHRKYIEHSKSTANYYYALHGLGESRIMNFIEKRFEYRDGYYGCGDLYKSIMGFRAVGTDISVKITAAKAGFFGLGIDTANEASEENQCYLEAGESHTFHSGITNTGSGTMLYLFGAKNIGELDLTGGTPMAQGWNISELTMLTRFIIGGEDYVPSEAGQATLTDLKLPELPFLKYLDVRNTKISSIDASKCPRLETVLAGGSLLKTMTFAETSPIERLELPVTMTALTFVGLPSLVYSIKGDSSNSLSLDGATAVGTLRVENTPKVDAIQLLRDIIDEQGDNKVLSVLRIADQDVQGDGSELLTVIANGVKGLDENSTSTTRPVVDATYRLTKIIEQDEVQAIEQGIEGITLGLHINAFISEIDESVNAASYGGEQEVDDITLDNLAEQLYYFNGETSAEAVEREEADSVKLSDYILQ